jgi:hypothetical protein
MKRPIAIVVLALIVLPAMAQNRNPGDLRSVDASTEYRRIEEDGEVVETWIFSDGSVRSKITDPRDGFSVDSYRPARYENGMAMVVSEDGFEEWAIPNVRMLRRFLALMKLDHGYTDSYNPFISHRDVSIVHDVITDSYSLEMTVKSGFSGSGDLVSVVLRRRR